MAAQPLHSKEITTAQVKAVSFGFFSDEEVRKISVLEVSTPVIFDNLKLPARGGLYDPRLGPMEPRERCATCGLGAFECPGHFGRVELAVPLYNPLVFATLIKVLRASCLHCFRLRMAEAEAERFRARLELLAAGRLAEAAALALGSSAAAKRAGVAMAEGEEDMDEGEELVAGKGRSTSATLPPAGAPIRRAAPSGAALEATIEAVGELFRRQPAGKCGNCGAHSPALRREGHAKVFAMPLPPKKRAANEVQGTRVLSVLARLGGGGGDAGDGDALAELETEAGAAERARSAARRAARDVGAGGAAAKPDSSDDDEDEDKAALGSDSDDGKKAGPPAPAAYLDLRQAKLGAAAAAAADAAAAAGGADGAAPAGGPGGADPSYLTPTEVREVLKRVWAANAPLLALVFPAEAARRARRRRAGAAPPRGPAAGWRDFFIQTVPVAPNRFRPLNKVGDAVYEHPQNTLLAKLLAGNLDLLAAARGAPAPAYLPPGAAGAAAAAAVAAAPPPDPAAALGRTLRLWLDLQNSLNALLDSSAAEETHGAQGIRQQLEKKEGLFRKNMMGKRVNFACRSVISPDVYLNGGEIGVPPYFASRLSFPERVTPWNLERLREAVVAGPGRNPGAVAVEDERGRVVVLRADRASREAVARALGAGVGGGAAPGGGAPGRGAAAGAALGASAAARYGGGKVVYRTMTDGDFMLTNRQPTLHRPGMMGHRARIMRAERTIRFHYANCATFNADFDGDEINLHLPQDHAGRAEGYGIVHADEQFAVPTDGKPLRGLIQDHIVAGTLLTARDTFLTQAEYAQLVYEAVATDCAGGWEVWAEPPALLAPRALWTGKQALTAVLMHYARDALPLTFSADTKTPAEAFGAASGEGRLRVWRGRLVTGVLDKNAFGKHGLLHAFHELYGPERTSLLTAALSRLLTGFLQRHGFTCGLSDVGLVAEAEAARGALLAGADGRALAAAAAFAGLGSGDADADAAAASADDAAFARRERAARAALAALFRENAAVDAGGALDAKVSAAMHPLSSAVVRACLPGGQARPFRHNQMALMTVTGAKGSVVNFSQISCLLGQQELEGRRVPRMASGKSLPCFAPFDAGARSGGFVGDRFLTGLRPQEYYFHCMAGREGLVDTTVKTSRSGYLQRCLVKCLEPLKVAYDGTVRDDCDGAVVQFLYGEDGVEAAAAPLLRALPLLFFNAPQLAARLGAAADAAAPRSAAQAADEAAARKGARRRAAVLLAGDVAAAAAALPVSARLPPAALGVTSEGFSDALADALFGGMMLPPAGAAGAEAAFRAADKAAKKAAAGTAGGKKAAKKAAKAGALAAPGARPLDAGDFLRLMHLRFQRALAPPGEAVGVLAAQSIGEPSTQMTLNTFHMAGRGEANVTLGIPRLREILMTAAAKIRTPVMTLPLRPGAAPGAAAALATRLRRVRLAEALAGLRVEENVVAGAGAAGGGERARVYTVRLQFHEDSAYPPELGLTFAELAEAFTRDFVPRLQKEVKAELRKLAADAKAAPLLRARAPEGGEEGGAAAGAPAPAKAPRRRSEKDGEDENAEADAENEEGKLRFAGGRGEQATYGAGDAEDAEIAAAAAAAGARRAGEAFDDDDASDDASDAGGGAEADSGAADASAAAPPGEARAGVDAAARAAEVAVTLPLGAPKLLMREVAERAAAAALVRGVPGVSKVYVQEGGVQTDGINLPGAWAHGGVVDVDRLSTNSPAAMLAAYGVEAARATVLAEVSSVFGAYGIAVDPRHLSLIADAMTRAGGYRACSRLGIESSTSPLLKISFETATAFLVAATLHGDGDALASPAARIVLGRPVGVGTGAMEVLQRLPQ